MTGSPEHGTPWEVAVEPGVVVLIVVKLFGGLGNQMFQYAAARQLALSHNTEVLLDLRWFGACLLYTSPSPRDS